MPGKLIVTKAGEIGLRKLLECCKVEMFECYYLETDRNLSTLQRCNFSTKSKKMLRVNLLIKPKEQEFTVFDHGSLDDACLFL